MRFDSQSPHLACYDTDRPKNDRELYYRLIDGYTVSGRATGSDPLGTYQALLYWKLYSQPAAIANLAKWMTVGSEMRRSAASDLPRLLTSLPAALDRSVDAVVKTVQLLDTFQLPGMRSTSAIPVRTTFLHFIYPSTVPVFDRMVLQAVGVDQPDANHSYTVLREYLPFAWKLADQYAERTSVGYREQTLRLIDMALWVNRGRR